MPIQFYIVPKIGDGTPRTNPFRAKYIDDDPLKYATGTGLSPSPAASMMDYGLEAVMLVGASVDAAQDTFLSAQADVTRAPNNIDTIPSSAALTLLKSRLETLRIPSDWVTGAHSYRDVMRFVTQLCQLHQRYAGRVVATLFAGGITLDSTVGQIPAGQRLAFRNAASDLGIDLSLVTNATTIRSALRILCSQLPPITLMGVPL